MFFKSFFSVRQALPLRCAVSCVVQNICVRFFLLFSSPFLSGISFFTRVKLNIFNVFVPFYVVRIKWNYLQEIICHLFCSPLVCSYLQYFCIAICDTCLVVRFKAQGTYHNFSPCETKLKAELKM